MATINGTKRKQIMVRFDDHSYAVIREHAALEHRGLCEFVRHAVLAYMENSIREKELPAPKKGGTS